jgi:hypothetical protein
MANGEGLFRGIPGLDIIRKPLVLVRLPIDIGRSVLDPVSTHEAVRDVDPAIAMEAYRRMEQPAIRSIGSFTTEATAASPDQDSQHLPPAA